MNDKDELKWRTLVRRYVERWSWLVTRSGWDVEFEYERTHGPDSKLTGDESYAEVRCAWQYMRGTIRFYLGSIATIFADRLPRAEQERKLEQIVLHEYMHFFVDEMLSVDDQSDETSAARQHTERVVELLARAIMGTRARATEAAENGQRRRQRQSTPSATRQVPHPPTGSGDGAECAGCA